MSIGVSYTPSPGGDSMSHTELYMKYVDATQQCRQEKAFRRRNEVLLEQVVFPNRFLVSA